MQRSGRRSPIGALLGLMAAALVLVPSALPAGALRPAHRVVRHHANGPNSGYLVYWDQDEEVDYYESANASQGQVMAPWDLNGQVCVLNDGTGRYIGGVDPTNSSQHNPGSPPALPFKQPAIGEELDNPDGSFTGQMLYVPGPYRLAPGQVGEDSPADASGQFNGQSTYTGCAVDPEHNLFADDIGTAQGAFPAPTDGRLVEWFAPSYNSYCILTGPTTGGVDGDHHVDGSGGLAQPGMMTDMPNGNLLLPQAANATGNLGGDVLELDHSSFPTSASQCPDGVYPQGDLKSTVFFQGTTSLLPLPSGVAYDPPCNCYAVDSILGDPSIVFVSPTGQVLSRPSIPGESLAQFGHDPTGYNPFGMAFAPDGTLYFIDIHVACASGFNGCGPQDFKGRVMRVTFGAGNQPSPATEVSGGFAFPTSVTVCVPAQQTCPFPTHKTPPPTRENPGESE